MDKTVILKTNKGDIKIKLNAEKAPVSVKNFLTYVDEGFYNGTIFHRVIPKFMIQGGGFGLDFKQKKTHDPIKNEADNGLKNTRGTIAMARTSDPNSATAQFFINLVDNSFLDFKSATPSGYGYAVFGEVIDGMDVVDAIAASRTATKDGYADVPVEPIEISSVIVE
ncbi:MAG: peptidylprolyl isomerase [Gammaproteobacteria bacterium]